MTSDSRMPAGFFRRFLAQWVDCFFILIGLLFVSWSLQSILLWLLFILCYHSLFTISPLQATPGKYIFKIYVGNADNARKINLVQAILRCTACYLPLFILIWGLVHTENLAVKLDPEMTVQEQKTQKIYDAYNTKVKNHVPITAQDKVSISKANTESFESTFPFIIPLVTTLFGLTYYFLMFVMIAGKEKRAYHDLFAGTYVVYGRHSPFDGKK